MSLGDIVQLLDSESFVQNQSQPATLRKRNKNVVVLVSSNVNTTRCLVRSIGISDLGIINATALDSLILDTGAGRDMGLIHWHENIFVVYANDQGGNEHLWTVSCDGSGSIPATPTDYLQLAGKSNIQIRSHLLKPHDTVLIVAGSYSATPHMLQTAIITDAGAITDPVADIMDLPGRPRIQRLRHGLGNIIVELYNDDTNVVFATYTCTTLGLLPANVIDSWALTTSDIRPMSLCKVSNTVYAIFIKDSDDKPWIHTFSINANGTINKSYLDSEQLETTTPEYPEMIELGYGYFLLAYKYSSTVLRLKTFFISEAGDIQDGHISTLDRAVSDAANPWFQHLTGDIWTLIYQSPATSIHLDTLEIETPTAERPHHEMIMKIGP